MHETVCSMDRKRRHALKTHFRAFGIWQKLGFLPWRKPKGQTVRKRSGDFYRGAFNSIPFLNEDAKRTFSHLLMRPGYMIRDYIKGDHERYLAPLTALIIFYAFFALVSAVMQPVRLQKQEEGTRSEKLEAVDEAMNDAAEAVNNAKEYRLEDDPYLNDHMVTLIKNTAHIIVKGWVYLNLDRYPGEVDTQHESSIAALESTLRNQGIPLFVGPFILLWLAMAITLRRQKLRMSAYAAASAYILCQFSFFMLFTLLLTLGKDAEIGLFLMLLLLSLDYHQWLGLRFRKSFWLAVRTLLWYGVLYCTFIVLVGGLAFLVAWLRQ